MRDPQRARAAQEGWLGLFYHDPVHAFGRLRKEGRRYVCAPVEGELLDPVA